MHLCAELIAAFWMLGPFGEVGANFSLQLSSRTQFSKIIKKKVIAKNQCEKHIKSSLYLYKEPNIQSKEEGKDQTEINTTNHQTGPGTPHNKATKTQENLEKAPQTRDHPIPAGDHKATRNRQDGRINTNIKHKKTTGILKRSTAFKWPVNSRVQRVSYLHVLHMFNFYGVHINILLV